VVAALGSAFIGPRTSGRYHQQRTRLARGVQGWRRALAEASTSRRPPRSRPWRRVRP